MALSFPGRSLSFTYWLARSAAGLVRRHGRSSTPAFFVLFLYSPTSAGYSSLICVLDVQLARSCVEEVHRVGRGHVGIGPLIPQTNSDPTSGSPAAQPRLDTQWPRTTAARGETWRPRRRRPRPRQRQRLWRLQGEALGPLARRADSRRTSGSRPPLLCFAQDPAAGANCKLQGCSNQHFDTTDPAAHIARARKKLRRVRSRPATRGAGRRDLVVLGPWTTVDGTLLPGGAPASLLHLLFSRMCRHGAGPRGTISPLRGRPSLGGRGRGLPMLQAAAVLDTSFSAAAPHMCYLDPSVVLDAGWVPTWSLCLMATLRPR